MNNDSPNYSSGTKRCSTEAGFPEVVDALNSPNHESANAAQSSSSSTDAFRLADSAKRLRRSDGLSMTPLSAINIPPTPDGEDNNASMDSIIPKRTAQLSSVTGMPGFPDQANASTNDAFRQEQASSSALPHLMGGRAASSALSTQGTSQGVGTTLPTTDASDHVPMCIINTLTERESELLTQKMKNRGHNSNTSWPAFTFAKVYLKYGNSDAVKRYARLTVQTTEAVLAFQRATEVQQGARSPSTDREMIPVTRSVVRIPLENEYGRPGPWNAVDVGMLRETTDVASIFKDIDFKHQKALLDSVRKYDPLDTNIELRDWCTWYDTIRHYVISLSLKEANFVLIKSVLPTYTIHIIETDKDQILTMPNETLARRIGCVVYRRANINPCLVANSLCRGKNGIADPIDLFRRIVDLHHCTFNMPSGVNFILDMLHTVASYIPYKVLYQFYQSIFHEYPSIKEVKYPTYDDTYGRVKPRESATVTTNFPTTATEICHFAEFLKRTAAITCVEVGGPVFRDQIKRTQSAPQRGRIITAGVNYVATVPMDSTTPTVPKAEIGTAGVTSTPEGRLSRHCTHCDARTHTVDQCWHAHPEIKGARQQEIMEKRKARSAARFRSHQANAQQRPLSGFPLGSPAPTRGRLNQGRGGFRPQQVGALQVHDSQINNVRRSMPADFRP